MIKSTILLLLFKTIVFAGTISQSEQKSIFLEGILFVVVFGAMGLISYIYSSRHAKAYKPKKEKEKEEIKHPANAKRILELEKILKNKILTQKEFEILKQYHLQLKT